MVESASLKQILCMKWGTMYGPEYVNILYSMIARNITGPFRLICFTDDPTGIRSEVRCYPLPELGCEIPPDVPGKWKKQALWGRDLFGLEGVALFLDLDSVIVDNIDGYFEYGHPDDVITARNWVRWTGRHAQTSVFRFRIGSHPYMLDDLRADPVGISRRYRMEQNYVTAHIRGGVKFWPEPWTKHYGIHCLGPWPIRCWRDPVLPKGAKIITFPGRPKPPNAIVGRWSDNVPVGTVTEHWRWVWRNRHHLKNLRKQIAHYIRPCPWLAEHWRL